MADTVWEQLSLLQSGDEQIVTSKSKFNSKGELIDAVMVLKSPNQELFKIKWLEGKEELVTFPELRTAFFEKEQLKRGWKITHLYSSPWKNNKTNQQEGDV